MNVNTERDKEIKMQQYREETETEAKLVFLPYHSESISQSEHKSRISLLGSEDKNTQT